MAAFNQGLTTLTWGVPTLSGFVVQSSTISSKFNINESVPNESGVIVYTHRDDLTKELSLEAIVAAGTAPAPGSIINYNATAWEVLSYDIKNSNKACQTISIKAQTSQGITLS